MKSGISARTAIPAPVSIAARYAITEPSSIDGAIRAKKSGAKPPISEPTMSDRFTTESDTADAYCRYS